jgi:hypothetical protein
VTVDLFHGLDTFGERRAVLESAAIRGQNRGCVWKNYSVSGETGNHCHKRLANYYQVMRLIPHKPSNQTMKPTPIAKQLQRACHSALPWLISFSLGG